MTKSSQIPPRPARHACGPAGLFSRLLEAAAAAERAETEDADLEMMARQLLKR
jgi:hypothetical protein